MEHSSFSERRDTAPLGPCLFGAQLKTEASQTNETVRDHEHRIRGLERARWQLAGIVAGAGAAGSFVATYLAK